ncbi:MAG: hypothetical protein H0T79_18575, partial [Deltaproteobacteria bacterium]|nr:hypothetical protein [Deltaproteobacteria bacterium]
LTPSLDDQVRVCGACQRPVRYCMTFDEANACGEELAGMVVDPALERSRAYREYKAGSHALGPPPNPPAPSRPGMLARLRTWVRPPRR